MSLYLRDKSWMRVLCFLFFTLLSLTLSVNKVNSQTIVSAMGGVDTNFIIQSNSSELDVLKQCVIRRGNYESNFSSYQDEDRGEGSFGYGYGLQMIYLEFVSYSKIIEVRKKKSGSNKKYYQVDLFDDKNKHLVKVKLKFNEVKQNTNNSDLRTYSINFNKIPLVLLDITKTIEITLIDPN